MIKDYSQHGMPPVLPSLLWALLCLAMWFWAIIGPLCVVLGVAAYFVDLSGVLSIPRPQALTLGSVLGFVGITFVWLRRQGYIRFGEE
jgi:hypothetical protein